MLLFLLFLLHYNNKWMYAYMYCYSALQLFMSLYVHHRTLIISLDLLQRYVWQCMHAFLCQYMCYTNSGALYLLTVDLQTSIRKGQFNMSDHFPCHTAYHSNFFVLRLDVHFNRLPVKLNFSSDGQLELCGQPAESVVLSMDVVGR